MIKKIKFSNYKAFLEGEIDVCPIVVLLGSNSSGKSSILQSLLLLQQSLNIAGGYDSALKLNGKLIKLGEDENLLWNRDTSKDLVFSIKISSNNFNHKSRLLLRDVRSELQSIFETLSSIIGAFFPEHPVTSDRFRTNLYRSLNTINDDNEFFLEEIPKLLRKYRKILKEHSVSEVEDRLIKSFEAKKRGPLLSKDDLDLSGIGSVEINHYRETIHLIEGINGVGWGEYTVRYTLRIIGDQKKFQIHGFRLTDSADNTIINYYKEKGGRGKRYINKLSSSFIDDKVLDKQRNKFERLLEFHALEIEHRYRNTRVRSRSIYDGVDFQGASILSRTILGLMGFSTDALVGNFSLGRLNYIGPLRAFPERYYFLDESVKANSLSRVEGKSLAEILKKNRAALQKVNKWLKRFDLKVNVEVFRDVIHKIKISQHNLKLDITDVGFGISQVLPIILQGMLAEAHSTTIVEQPEIHLHPRLQAELADLFIDLIKDESGKITKSFIVETHSEYFLKRLRRRMAEQEKITSNEVGIYFVHQRKSGNAGAKIEKIDIGPNGAFDWPEDFYTDDLDDTIEFLKHQ